MSRTSNIKSLYKTLLKLEKSLPALSDADLNEAKRDLKSLEESEDASLVRLSQASAGLKKTMTLQELMIFIVPIERHLNKSLQDSDFLEITEKDADTANKTNSLTVVLDNIRSSFNVGALFRTCEILGVREVYVTGYTQGSDSSKVIKTSMGTASDLNVVRCRDLKEVHEKLNGYTLVALETCKESVSLHDFEFTEKTALIVGNEKFGLAPNDLKICDHVIHLPVCGKKNSLNVNASLAVGGYEWLRQCVR